MWRGSVIYSLSLSFVTSSVMAENSIDPMDHLPLPLVRSDVIPPAPNRSGHGHGLVIDWLPHFGGSSSSWVAYGASSLCVISHFPSPHETLIGPIFRQVFHLSGDPSASVAAVSWSSQGDVAAALANSIAVFSHDSKGSFCWSQTALLVQSTKVEAIEWTGSGDGLISGGIEVVLWKHRSRAWEIAWKFRTAQPQTLVSSTWFIEGPSASAVYPNELNSVGSSIYEASKTVSICHSDGKSEYKKTELHHPQPVLMIQWRPSIKRQPDRDTKHSPRHVLLTCCLDGTVRLWTEIDTGRVRKANRDISEQKTMRHSYCAVAVIEINQVLDGALGINVFVKWATETGGIIRTDEEENLFLSTKGDEHDNSGRCEWLVGFGPGTSATFWAIHCLDDVSPLRFPRVTLWKRQESLRLETGNLHRYDCSNVEDLTLLNKAIIQRIHSSGPPATLSSVHSLRSNSLVWSHLYNGAANGVEDGSINKSRTENSLASSTNGDLNLDGHTGKFLQVVPHPSRSEVELAVSIDSNGLLLFWSISSITNYDFGLPVFVPSWKLCGKHDTQVSFPKYVSLTWVSLMFDEDRVLLMGHVGGVDCFIVKVAQGQEGNIGCHKLCTIPFTDNCSEDGPTSIFYSHLPSTCNETLGLNRFMLLGIWMNGFQALSWEITLHSCDINGGCCYCNVDGKDAGECNTQNFKNVIGGKRYCLGVNPCSPRFPDPHTCDCVTSFAVICPGSIFPPIQKYQVSTNFPWSNGPAYIIATGCSDGSLKLWRSNSSKSLTSHAEWELVGMFVAHHGPVRTISLSECGRKIATVGAASHSAKMDTLKIWDSIPLTGTGCFMLEETISLHGDIVDLKWLTIGNGQLLLGVCMQKELRIYGQRRCGSLPMLHSGRSEKIPIWTCIAFAHVPSPIVHLLWGPRASAVVVHDNYFCLFSQWLFLLDKKHHNKLHPNYIKDNLFGNYAGMDKDIIPAIFTDSCICDFKELSVEDSRESYKPRPQIDQLCSSLFASRTLLKHGFNSKFPFWSMTELSEKLCGSLPIYHPEALLMNIYSGNWKRACRAVRHLVEYINCKDDSATACSLTESSQIVPQIILSKYFDGNLSKASTDQGFHWNGVSSSLTSSSQFQEDFNQFAYSSYSDSSNAKLTTYSSKSELSSFIEPVKKLSDLAAVNDMEKIQLLAIIDILGELSSPDSASVYGSLDEPGQRFWIAVRFQQLYSVRRVGRLAAIEELNIDSGMIGWAFHSDCQENLFGSLLPNEPSWQEMRALGTGFWFTNATQLRAKMEKLARSQFLKKRDPKDCALLYIALKRFQVLAGLFKLSKDEKDKPLVGFLSRNFQEEKNKAAALKNAYVLMGRHQLELAVAFFLLGGDTSSAITVCAKNLGDEQLALVICRLVEGQGGSLERQLITKYILPSAIEKHDYWLASLMEWQIGNYSQSFVSMLGFQMNSAVDMLTFSSNQVAFLDPSIGLYCLTLAAKNSLRNAVGEQNAAILSKWATLMTATALNRCGLPLESLECRASSVSGLGGIDQGSLRDNRHSGNIHQVLKPSPNDSTNWMLGDVAFHLESHAKLDLALQYFSKLVKEHPSWPDFTLAKIGYTACSNEFHQQKMLLDNFQHKFHTGLESCDQKFSLSPSSLTRLVLIFLCNNGLMFIGHDLIGEHTSEDCLQDGSHAGSYHLNPLLCTLLLKVSEEVSSTCSRYITACGINFYQPNTYHIENDVSAEVRSRWLDALGYSIRGLMMSICELRAALGKSFGSLEEDLINKPVTILDLYEYCVHFAAAWVQKNSKLLIMMVQPLLITYTNGHSPYELDIGSMKKILSQILESATYTVANGDVGTGLKVAKCLQEKPAEDLLHTFHSIPEDERWQIVGVCLWQHMSNLMDHKLKLVSDELEGNSFPSVVSHSSLSSWASCLANVGSDRERLPERIRLVSLKLAKTLSITLSHISSSNIKQFASLLRQKAENGLNTHALLWLEESTQSKSGIPCQHQNQDILTLDMMRDLDELSVTKLLQDMCADPKIIFEGFARAKLDLPRSFKHKPSEKWSEIHKGIIEEHETEVTCNHEGMLGSSSASGEAGSPSKVPFMNGHTLSSSWQKDNTLRKEVTTFQNPKEVYKRNGELLEAICINSIDQRQAALASNRKGIVFFSWEDDLPSRDQSDYIWSVADWPQNGWAGSESTPVPIFASPGVGVGSKKGAYLGLGGTTSGGGFMARPGRDLMVGGTFGLPGYASIGASGLGWGIQEDFEEFSDPAPTIGNISTRALYSHPSRPFFLVGSSNTHIYLWEFGKNIATATYGVLPAVNVPPPYALASISAVQFDLCGQRFATAALDGTVSTWQLEVGGRSNIRPTESSPCFSSYTSDVTYITSSGSIIAASGYSSNGANVVIWDALAPPSTSRASIICHEGGARSLSVFDNDIGSGSVSPLILTGGKGGDIGLHDFRYIATGRTKRHKHSGNGEHSQNVSDVQTGAANKPGDQNSNGMLWYIPKAHSGSVTKISTVPNTSLFLTGSKDGDVKLWDAKKGELVYHWPKLHERHTFLQPSSRGYGGVVRAAVTDIQVVSNGFLTCGGDGHVKLIQLKD